MTPWNIIKYGLIAAVATLVMAGGIYGVERFMLHQATQRHEHTSALTRDVMLRVWHTPVLEPQPDELTKLLVLCAYASPHTRDQIVTYQQTLRFLGIWREAIERDGPDAAIAVVSHCQADPTQVDPTPPQLLIRQAIMQPHRR